jgi:hypothetical protein
MVAIKNLFAKTFVFATLVFMFFGLSAISQTNVKQADLSFKETTHQFVDVIEGNLAIFNFGFKNTGNAKLLLKNVKASCGCTSPSWPHDSINPGDSGHIKVAFNSNGYAGRTFSKSVTITTNINEGGQDKMAFLYINGNVIPKQYPIKFSEPSRSLGDIKKGKPIQWNINLVNDGDSVVNIKEIKASNTFITVKPAAMIIAPHQSLTLAIILATKDIEPKDISESVKVITHMDINSTMEITSKGYQITAKILGKK